MAAGTRRANCFVMLARPLICTRCREGENYPGGLGTVARVLPNFFYDIKYAVDGLEKDVDACFVEKTTLVSLLPLCRGACLIRSAVLRCDVISSHFVNGLHEVVYYLLKRVNETVHGKRLFYSYLSSMHGPSV